MANPRRLFACCASAQEPGKVQLQITGADWDSELHQKAVELVNEGKLTIPVSADGRTPNAHSITVDDVNKF